MADMVELTCGQCGIKFSIPEKKYGELRQSHNTFYCPNGHARYFCRKTDEEKRIEQLEAICKRYKGQIESYQERYMRVIRSRAYYKGRLNKLLKEAK